MPTPLHILKSQFYDQLKGLYPEREIGNFMYMTFEHVLGFSKIDIIIKENEVITEKQANKINTIIKSLCQNQPIQYILGHAHFYGLQLKVNQNVLIPRQETEELVDLVINFRKAKADLRIIDIGTGSGCIAIALKKHLPQAIVYAVDVSEKAIALATENAIANNTNIKFIAADILNKNDWYTLRYFEEVI